MKSKYEDLAAVAQVIGCVFNNSSLLDDTDKYVISEQDFADDFHRIIFGSIYNIYLTGSQVNIDAIVDYLENRHKFNAIFKQGQGVEYILEASQIEQQSTFYYLSLIHIFETTIPTMISFSVLIIKKQQTR